MLDDWEGTPKEITLDIIEQLGFGRKEKKKSRGKYIENSTPDEEFKKIEKQIWKLPEDFAEDRDNWVHIAMALKEFGDKGYDLWELWSEKTYFSKKPNSKRIGDLMRVWENIRNERDDKITVGSLYFWTNQKNESPF